LATSAAPAEVIRIGRHKPVAASLRTAEKSAVEKRIDRERGGLCAVHKPAGDRDALAALAVFAGVITED
jgi:hypothetical protein